MNPIDGRFLHSLQRQLSGFYFLIWHLKTLTISNSLKFPGNKFRILAPRFEIISDIWYTEFTLEVVK